VILTSWAGCGRGPTVSQAGEEKVRRTSVVEVSPPPRPSRPPATSSIWPRRSQPCQFLASRRGGHSLTKPSFEYSVTNFHLVLLPEGRPPVTRKLLSRSMLQ